MIKKLIFITLVILSFSVNIFAQEEQAEEFQQNEDTGSATVMAQPEEGQLKTKPVDFLLCFEPTLIINTGSHKDSAVSPIVYPFSFGAIFFKDFYVSFQPRISFFENYYLWVDDAAYPAEVENRTAVVYSLLLDLPAVYTFNFAKKHSLEVGLGPSFNFRITTLANGVKASDAGTSGTAEDDVDKINDWFWDDANFLFIQTQLSYLYQFLPSLKIGPEIKFYLPMGQICTGNALNAGMFSIGIKAIF